MTKKKLYFFYNRKYKVLKNGNISYPIEFLVEGMIELMLTWDKYKTLVEVYIWENKQVLFLIFLYTLKNIIKLSEIPEFREICVDWDKFENIKDIYNKLAGIFFVCTETAQHLNTTTYNITTKIKIT